MHPWCRMTPNQLLYIGSRVQAYLSGLDAECEEQRTRCILGVQSAMEGGNALACFSTVVVATPGKTNRALKSNRAYGIRRLREKNRKQALTAEKSG